MEHIITSNLKTMVNQYDHITICKDFKFVYVPIEDEEWEQRVRRQIEMVNAKDYSKQEIIDNYDLDTKVIKWVDTFTEDGEPSMAVVLEG